MFSKQTFRKMSIGRNGILATMFVLSMFALPGVLVGSTASTVNITYTTTVTPKITLDGLSLLRQEVGGAPTVAGVGFMPNHLITITFNGVVMNNVVTMTNSTGGFSKSWFTVAPTPAGTYPVVAFDGVHKASAKVKIVPFVTPIGHYVAPGGSMTFLGSGFAASSLVSFKMSNGANLGSVTTGANGEFTYSALIPSNTPAGKYTITCTDASGNSRTITFHVT
jgi:hypothetical protein